LLVEGEWIDHLMPTFEVEVEVAAEEKQRLQLVEVEAAGAVTSSDLHVSSSQI
jgi:hypothetical protein